MSDCPLWSQLVLVAVSALFGAGFTHWFKKRSSEYSIEKQKEIYESALEEIEDEWSHIENIASASSEEEIRTSSHVHTLTPYNHIKDKTEKLYHFKRYRIFSRHFRRYYFISRAVINKCKKGVSLIHEDNATDLKNNAEELLDELEKCTNDWKKIPVTLLSRVDGRYNPALQLKMGAGRFQASSAKRSQLRWAGVTKPVNGSFVGRVRLSATNSVRRFRAHFS